MKTSEEIENYLVQCNGCDHLVRHWTGLLYTEGLQYIAEHAGGGAYWLLDLIASYQPKCRKDRQLREFQVWELKVDLEKKTARVTCLRDAGVEAFHQDIEFSDFPLPELRVYVENNTICLPQER